ncbi:MAG: hypothetical protein JSW35_02070 [Deltaproteobacteria bacterium]|nr:MAG: hypothetical protein JSW35_02070 [Deltaproteobacteria bacterium]
MKYPSGHQFFMAVLILLTALGITSGCDSGEKMVDEVTGNRAVKQYHKSKKDIEKITEQQAERYEGIPDDEREDEKQ